MIKKVKSEMDDGMALAQLWSGLRITKYMLHTVFMSYVNLLLRMHVKITHMLHHKYAFITRLWEAESYGGFY